jgi:nucleoside-diphosphate-sugar epimerase
MKILVTGATGFVGQHVINELLKYDHRIIAAVRNKKSVRNIPDTIKIIELDLDKLEVTKNYFSEFRNPDLLIHLAWQGLPNYKASFHVEKNLPAHSAFLKNMVENGLQNLVVTGTCFEYGIKDGCLSEDMESDPQNSYAIAKDQLRKFLEDLQHENHFTLKWIRLFYMYGKGQNPNSLLSQLESALQRGETNFNMSGGEQLRDYLSIETVAEYILKIALQNKINGILNCCSGVPVKVKTFVENYLEKNNKKINLNLGYYPYPDYEAMAFWGDDKKLKRIITND